MPRRVDKDTMRMQILVALQSCVEDKPLGDITLRDVASAAGISHAKLLYYFENRDDLMTSYVRLTRDSLSDWCERWFASHNLEDYASKRDFINAFLTGAYERDMNANRPNATIQTYVLAHYDEAIARTLQEEYQSWHDTMQRCLSDAFGAPADEKVTSALMVIASGIFVCNYNGAPVDATSCGFLDCLADI